MKIIKYYIVLTCLILASTSYAQQVLTGESARRIISGAEMVRTSRYSSVPDFIRFNKSTQIPFTQFKGWLVRQCKLSPEYDFQLLSQDSDKLGFTHYRYQQTYKGIPVQGTMYIVHVKNGKVVSMNGMIFNDLQAIINPSISEQTALQTALNFMKGGIYRWQSSAEEEQLKKITGDPNATWYPKGELMLTPVNGVYKSGNYRLCYRFDIYCEKPLKRQYIFVDVQTGEIIYTIDRIDNSTVLGTALTAYSGTRKINTDSISSKTFHLDESKRGNGVVTYNLQQGTNYGTAVDFTNTTDYWDQVNANLDQYATDAQWGAERTFDFYDSTYNRYSLDNAGLQLVSYVHYDANYVNAFWDGTEMNYGDGDASLGYTPLTCIDICGHEMTHGVTQFTCNLNYQDESGALDESFSDCAGMAIEIFSHGNTDWLIGSEIGTPFRSMHDPKLYGQPDTYLGINWYVGTDDYGGVHTNSGVQNFWFYILSQGDTGTNDNGDSYSIKGIGIHEAHAITFRNQTVYLFPTAQYNDARFYAIQSAIDLYGACSNEEMTTTNAWYAVGVGGKFVDTVISNFSTSETNFCSVPATVSFANSSTNGQSFKWEFGDKTTDTIINPTHKYTQPGTYSVTLVTNGGTCGIDSSVKKNLISISLPASPTSLSNDSICPDQEALLTASATGNVEWYSADTGGTLLFSGTSYTTPKLASTTTFYAENFVGNTQSVGPVDNTIGTGGYFAYNTHYEIFNCYAPCTLVSVVLYANTSGTQVIELADSLGNTLDSLTVSTVSGKNTITLNFLLPVENGLLLGLGSTSDGGLYRNNSGAVFPYTIASLISITGTDVGLTLGYTNYFYFYYDWQIQKACISERTPITVTVSPLTVGFTYTHTTLTADFTNTSVGATSYHWNFGDGGSSTSPNPSHTYSSGSTYTVTLVASNGTCNDTITQIVNLSTTGINTTQVSNGINVVPNPFNNTVTLKMGVVNPGSYDIRLANVLGQVIVSNTLSLKAGENDYNWDLSSLASGMYFIQLQSQNNSYVVKVIKQE